MEYVQLKARIDALSLDEIRATPVWEKCQQICDLSEAYREMLRGKLRERYPLAREHEIKMRLSVIMNGRELVNAVYGWEGEGDDTDLDVERGS
jgi:hypothetical protein